MNHVPLSRLLDRYERFGIDIDTQIVVVPGAEKRRARMFIEGYNRGVQAKVNHHTAERFGTRPQDSVNYIMSGNGAGFVISNFYTEDPNATGRDYSRIWILALGGGTYTEGRGGPRGLIPSGGANRVALSDEHAGGGRAWHPAHLDLIVRKNAADCDLLAELNGWQDDPFGPDRLFDHAEWAPGRKVDMSGWTEGRDWSLGGTWIGDRFRRDVKLTHAIITAPPPPPVIKPKFPPPAPPTSEEDEMPAYIFAMKNYKVFPAVFAVWESGTITHVGGEELDYFRSQKVHEILSDNVDSYKAKLIATGQPGKFGG